MANIDPEESYASEQELQEKCLEWQPILKEHENLQLRPLYIARKGLEIDVPDMAERMLAEPRETHLQLIGRMACNVAIVAGVSALGAYGLSHGISTTGMY